MPSNSYAIFDGFIVRIDKIRNFILIQSINNKRFLCHKTNIKLNWESLQCGDLVKCKCTLDSLHIEKPSVEEVFEKRFNIEISDIINYNNDSNKYVLAEIDMFPNEKILLHQSHVDPNHLEVGDIWSVQICRKGDSSKLYAKKNSAELISRNKSNINSHTLQPQINSQTRHPYVKTETNRQQISQTNREIKHSMKSKINNHHPLYKPTQNGITISNNPYAIE